MLDRRQSSQTTSGSLLRDLDSHGGPSPAKHARKSRDRALTLSDRGRFGSPRRGSMSPECHSRSNGGHRDVLDELAGVLNGKHGNKVQGNLF